jgi:hypothetical protein
MSTFDDKVGVCGVSTGKCAPSWIRFEKADMRFDSF